MAVKFTDKCSQCGKRGKKLRCIHYGWGLWLPTCPDCHSEEEKHGVRDQKQTALTGYS
jgi:hypothetical protein